MNYSPTNLEVAVNCVMVAWQNEFDSHSETADVHLNAGSCVMGDLEFTRMFYDSVLMTWCIILLLNTINR
ncbi:hypothetical protein TNCV_4471671 [Trichonephila clavipes]|uniref:Uncharacterized protein n=1 Tax=Trichonephila clavipes TaxID=2585209 RepID=A0A8X6SMQ3_TRICX|nr:hypothetical protein TNCV_4471671 [Trichonephila clavipes]